MISPEESKIRVAVVDKNVYVKPCGYASQDNSLGIPDFLEAMFRAGCNTVTFDLSECADMDSTFLGVIADAALPARPGRSVIVVNANERAQRLLRQVGLTSLVRLARKPVKPPADLQFCPIDQVHFPKSEQQRLDKIRRLHQELADLNARNRCIFASFLAMLEEELKQQGQ